MMLWDVPSEVKRFFRPVTKPVSVPIRRALPGMVLAFLLAPHRRALKTIAGMVAGHRCHVGTISRRLDNPLWHTRDWYASLNAHTLSRADRGEGRQAKGCRRRWFVVIDTTYHESVGECMENMIVMSRRKHPARRTTRQHAFVMGMLLTDRGARLPLPRKSYYTESYCRTHRRRYAVAARRAAVSKLGECVIVASYKENRKVALLPGQSGDWESCHRAPISYRKEDRHRKARWHRKVLACTEPTATAEQVVPWYELRWQVELFFRELKSRMQFECYVLMKFTSVERYLDLLLMGFLLLEQQRLRDLRRAGAKVGAVWMHARTTDRLRMLEVLCQRWNVECMGRRLRTPGGRRRVLRQLLRQAPCQVASCEHYETALKCRETKAFRQS